MDGDDSKRPREDRYSSTSKPTSPGDAFEESFNSGDYVTILVNCMQNIKKQVKELVLMAQ